MARCGCGVWGGVCGGRYFVGHVGHVLANPTRNVTLIVTVCRQQHMWQGGRTGVTGAARSRWCRCIGCTCRQQRAQNQEEATTCGFVLESRPHRPHRHFFHTESGRQPARGRVRAAAQRLRQLTGLLLSCPPRICSCPCRDPCS